jgi:transcriptional regulator with XRE-family HTH domain
MSTFGELLRADRERLQLSQEQLAKMLDVSQQAVANWEAGTAQPRRERRVRLLQILGPNSELTKNPPRTEFIPVEDQPVSQPTATLRGQRLERVMMATNPEFRKQSEEAAARFEESRRKIQVALDRHAAQEQEFTQALPEELRAYIDGRITVGAQTRQLDYLSPRWGIEIKQLPNNRFMSWNSSAPALLKLAVVRGIADQGLRPPREYSLILVNDAPSMRPDGTMQKLMFDAGVLGISIYQVESHSQAAELVRQLETEGEDVADETDDGPANPNEGTW